MRGTVTNPGNRQTERPPTSDTGTIILNDIHIAGAGSRAVLKPVSPARASMSPKGSSQLCLGLLYTPSKPQVPILHGVFSVPGLATDDPVMRAAGECTCRTMRFPKRCKDMGIGQNGRTSQAVVGDQASDTPFSSNKTANVGPLAPSLPMRRSCADCILGGRILNGVDFPDLLLQREGRACRSAYRRC